VLVEKFIQIIRTTYKKEVTFSSSSKTDLATSPFCSKSSSKFILGTIARVTEPPTKPQNTQLKQQIKIHTIVHKKKKTVNKHNHRKHKPGSAPEDSAIHRKHHPRFP